MLFRSDQQSRNACAESRTMQESNSHRQQKTASNPLSCRARMQSRDRWSNLSHNEAKSRQLEAKSRRKSQKFTCECRRKKYHCQAQCSTELHSSEDSVAKGFGQWRMKFRTRPPPSRLSTIWQLQVVCILLSITLMMRLIDENCFTKL